MKSSRVVIVLVVLFSCPALIAQKNEIKRAKKLERAQQLFDQFDYPGALRLYEEIATEQDDQFVDIQVATCYRNIGNLVLAEEWYRKAALGKLPLEVQYDFAEVLLSNGKTGEAQQQYKLYLQEAPGDTRVKNRLASIANFKDLHKNTDTYDIRPAEINSPYSDFGPVFYDEGIIFASAREEVPRGKRYSRTNSAYLDLFFSKYDENGRLGTPEKLTKSINSKYHEGPATLYEDGTKMIFTRNNFDPKTSEKTDKTVRLQLFYSQKEENGSWGKPELIQLSDEKYSVGHPSVSKDGKTLYFSSNMPGGTGGTDLYMSRFEGSTWGTPKNLGETINTKGNEMFPFIHEDGSLYFASDGHGGLGGLDIYKATPGLASAPQNLGAPVNSSRDDFAFVMNSTGDFGYFSSNRTGGTGDDDLYQFTVRPPAPPVEPAEADSVVLAKNEPEYVYTVQILALLNPKTVDKSFLQDLEGVLKHDGKDGFHRYTFGEYTGLDNALETLGKIRDKGYEDAFIRKVKRYSELSYGPGKDVEKLYLSEKDQEPVL